jgi:hypothetical protein
MMTPTTKRRAMRAALTPAATSGRGWRVLDAPTVPHEELDQHARHIWGLEFHGAPWPEGWAVRWAALDGPWGLCVYQEKLVLIDERRMRGRSSGDLIRTLVHEMAHVLHKAEALTGNLHSPTWPRRVRRSRPRRHMEEA